MNAATITCKKECTATFPGKEGTRGSSATTDPQDRGWDSEGDVAEVSEAVLRRGASVGRAGAAVEITAVEKGFRPKDGTGKPPGPGGDVDFRGKKRKNQTHESTTDPDARLFTKSRGSEAKLSYMGHVLMETATDLWCKHF